MSQQNSSSIYSTAVLNAVGEDDVPALEAWQTCWQALEALNTLVAQALAAGINVEDYFPDDNGQYVVGTGTNSPGNVPISCGLLSDLGTFMVTEVAQWQTKYPHMYAYVTGTATLQTA